MPTSLEGLAGVAAIVLRQPVRAVRLLGAAEALREALNMIRAPVEQPHHESVLAALRGQLSETELSEAWQAGRRLTMQQAVAEALEVDITATTEHSLGNAA